MTVGDEQVERANPSSKDHNNLHSSNEKLASRKGKSCKGCLYYSSTLKSNSRNPVCVGITRSLPKGILIFRFYSVFDVFIRLDY
ncbi:hypothetical protein HanRHA438_Chr07g0304481 [Helianthus annuus]|nr:hypothetical protein HanRHA438_Chr07g0304481 [Helianthus annuus]